METLALLIGLLAVLVFVAVAGLNSRLVRLEGEVEPSLPCMCAECRAQEASPTQPQPMERTKPGSLDIEGIYLGEHDDEADAMRHLKRFVGARYGSEHFAEVLKVKPYFKTASGIVFVGSVKLVPAARYQPQTVGGVGAVKG